jgi:peptidoglycan/xylan/chitin deacetylase (PgdA/CDA1 family)
MLTMLVVALSRIIGRKPAFMRPPYGNYNDLVVSASQIRNQSLVLWDFDSGDSVGATKDQSEASYYDVLHNQHPSNLLALNHETYYSTAYQLLPYALQQLDAAGYQAVTVAECLGGQDPYFEYTTAGTKDVSLPSHADHPQSDLCPS